VNRVALKTENVKSDTSVQQDTEIQYFNKVYNLERMHPVVF
jgi:hypothetical protein